MVEGVGRGFGRHGDKQPPGPSLLVAGVGRKGWPRASAGQVRLGTQPECHSAHKRTQGCPSDAMGSRANATKRVVVVVVAAAAATAAGERGKRGGRGTGG